MVATTTTTTNAQPTMEISQMNNFPAAAPAAAVISEQPVSFCSPIPNPIPTTPLSKTLIPSHHARTAFSSSRQDEHLLEEGAFDLAVC